MRSMQIYHIRPKQVLNDQWSSNGEITHQTDRLVSEGQIEPIVMIPLETDTSGEPVQGCQWVFDLNHSDYWHYSPAQVEAARRLEWDDILVTY